MALTTFNDKDKQAVADIIARYIPAVAAGDVQIKAVACRTGVRIVVAVGATERESDPVGACISADIAGPSGEPIDLMLYKPEPAEFISDFLSNTGASILGVEVDAAAHTAQVKISNEDADFVAGEDNLNLFLAAQLTGLEIYLADSLGKKINTHNPGKAPDDGLGGLINLFKEGKLDEVVATGNKLLNSSDQQTADAARSLIGQALFKKGNYKEAQNIFELLTKGKDATAGEWFNLCTAATLSGDIDKGRKAFTKAISLETNQAKSLTLSFYYFQALSEMKEYSLAFQELERFRKLFTLGNGNTDLTHLTLSMGGIPPSFETIITKAQPILEHLGKQKAEAWLEDIAKHVDAAGRQYITGCIKKLRY